jgi:sugar lactone lactonase YvrE
VLRRTHADAGAPPARPLLPRRRFLPLLPLLLIPGCTESRGVATWAGTIDTLPAGTIVVTNPAVGVWDSASTWQVVEELRIGTLDGTGPDLFGAVSAIEIDAQGRLYVLEGQSQELRVFGRDGRHVRTIGRKGGGPGEFAQPIGLAWSPRGDLWIPDPQNTRISIVDTAGNFVRSHHMAGGWVMNPWPGGFDHEGAFYNFVPAPSPSGFEIRIVRYDTALTALDTLTPPRWTGPDNFFEFVSPDGSSRMRTGVPFSPGLDWQLSPDGDFWFALTGPYELYRVSGTGDTARKVTKPFERASVSGEDVDSALAGLDWFTRQGGKVDRSRIPSQKPAIRSLLVAQDGYLWVEPLTPDRQDQGRLFELFDPEGRYLGRVRLPFQLSGYPTPVIRGEVLVGVTRDELEVPFVVRARIVKPRAAASAVTTNDRGSSAIPPGAAPRSR